MYAFLFLTHEDLNRPDIWKQFFEKNTEHNIYIHPKFKKRVRSNFKKYIIPSYIETSWGDISIVKATLLLLQESFQNIQNKFFILCSESCIPLYNFSKFKKYIASFNNLSLFNLKEEVRLINRDINYLCKTSQFWILNRDDVEIILRYQNKYIDLFNSTPFFKKYIRGKMAVDEAFFLTLLVNEINHYKYNKCQSTYTKWFDRYTGVKHPINYCCFMKQDMVDFKKAHSFFVRKIDKYFNLHCSKQKISMIVYIGKYTSNKLIKTILESVRRDDFNLILFTYGEYQIPTELIKYCYFYWKTRGDIEEIYQYLINYELDFFSKRIGKGKMFLLGDQRDNYDFLQDMNCNSLTKIAMEKDNFYSII